jgi:hypothetical protein
MRDARVAVNLPDSCLACNRAAANLHWGVGTLPKASVAQSLATSPSSVRRAHRAEAFDAARNQPARRVTLYCHVGKHPLQAPHSASFFPP